MAQVVIRPGVAADVPAINSIVQAAYRPYIERMSCVPAPMTADYEHLVEDGDVWVLASGDTVCGMTIVRRNVATILVTNLAVDPAHQGLGFGRKLLDHAETIARQSGVDELSLYTNEVMHENLAIYAKLGWKEYDRAVQDGFRRVFMRKRLVID